MRILHLTAVYPEYARRFLFRTEGFSTLPFAAQESLFYQDFFAWADSWSRAMKRLGHEMRDLAINLEPMQRTWAAENCILNPHFADLDSIALAQVADFRPDVLFYNHYDQSLLRRIRENVHSIRLVVGWAGSSLPPLSAFKECDLVLSCAPESVEALRRAGMRAEQIHHAFDSNVLKRLDVRPANPNRALLFAGQVIIHPEYHEGRHDLLNGLFCRGVALDVYSDSFSGKPGIQRSIREEVLYGLYRSAGFAPLKILRRVPRIARYDDPSRRPFRFFPAYRKALRPALYGMELYGALARTAAGLNIHADTSPRAATNMRLWEITGAGACLLTDARSNLKELFDVNSEILTYGSLPECAEKAAWLLDHPAETEQIAKAGQRRTLRDHTYDQRAPLLEKLFQHYLN